MSSLFGLIKENYKPQVKIKLKRFDIRVKLLSEGHLIEFLQHSFLKPFTCP